MPKYYLLPTLLVFACALPVMAAESYGPTEFETKSLPAYCGGPGGGDWKSILGPDRIWNNHTCYGINRLNRYYKAKSKTEKNLHLQTALRDFSYSVDKLKPEFPLMPEIYMYRGITYKLMGRHAEALTDLNKSIDLNPKYAKSIFELADIYNSVYKKRDKALELVTEGLRHNPDSKPLQRRYTKFGGALPFPKPYIPDTPKSTTENKHEAPVKVDQETKTGSNIEGKTEDTSSNTTKANEDVKTTKETTAVSGLPTNPWCRFCPEPTQSQNPETSMPQAEPKGSP
jgi:tetratricopeptide (TPR) repeat protein